MSFNHISLLNDATELRELILENPALPVVVMTDAEVCAEDCGYWISTKVTANIGEIFDEDAPWNDEKTYFDQGDFEEDLEEWIWTECTDNSDSDIEPSEEELQKMVKEKMKEYEPYWKKCIIVRCNN